MSYATILEEINKLSIEERLALLETISHNLREELAQNTGSSPQLTPSQIRKLPREERQKIMSDAAKKALADYAPDGELPEFTRDF